jgi:formate hydrogenlyase regulatory protein HycA
VGGQFFASIHGAVPPGASPFDQTVVRWYVILHLFDQAGHHRQSDIWCAGVARLPFEVAEARLQRLLDELPGREYCDIAIRPFRVEQDGIVFGLIDESDPERGDWAELYPDRLGFHPPWEGLYDT